MDLQRVRVVLAEDPLHTGQGVLVQFPGGLHLTQRAQVEGEVSSRHEARALARFLTCSLQGLLVVSKVDPDPAVLRDITTVIVGALD